MVHFRRTLILALLLVAAGSLAFATGAAVIDGDADTFADDKIAVQPADGPNGQYAYLNDDDEIAIDVSASNPNIQDPSFEGVNVGATGTIDDVFTITYTGDRAADVWIEYESENVTFVADGGSVEGNANNVTLAPNQSVTVGLELDARGATAGAHLGADEFSIEASEAQPETTANDRSAQGAGGGGGGGLTKTVSAESDDRREFVASGIGRGDAVRFEADGMHLDGANVTLDGLDVAGVRNDRIEVNAAGTPKPVGNGSALTAPTNPRSIAYLAVDHDFDADEVDAMTVRFSASRETLADAGIDPRNVTFYRQSDAGDWTEKGASVVGEEAVRRRGLPEDRVHFRATTTEFSTFAVAERAARFNVTETGLDPRAIDPGETATVRATVENGGGAAGERSVTLTADGDPVANETVALAPNETATVALTAAFETPREYDLAVDGTDAGSLLVGDLAAGGGTDDEADAGTGTGRDNDAGAGDGTGGDGAAGGSGSGPTEEPGAIDLDDLGGLVVFVALIVVGIALVRRMPRS
ncbi:DUF1102 domain-containing protein [Halorubrum persicum]|uniref:DUF1102 domain-containing protein n=1 Tax=Halorubrum persicum TaxID=1383844 RepID=A0A2G1WJH4_9EURY|nr:CARDB domain-containing protein [Halorubrum persicum]PHQ39132.1 DUF1102 domain-containing protein [Halorubrum persicum]